MQQRGNRGNVGNCQWEFQDPKMEVPTIYKGLYKFKAAYVREYSQKIWPYMVQYLHFRILKFPLKLASTFHCLQVWQSTKGRTICVNDGIPPQEMIVPETSRSKSEKPSHYIITSLTKMCRRYVGNCRIFHVAPSFNVEATDVFFHPTGSWTKRGLSETANIGRVVKLTNCMATVCIEL